MDDFDRLGSDEERIEYLENLLKPVADGISGRTRLVRSEEDVHCTGIFEKRPVRLIMSINTGGLDVEVKLKNTVGTILLSYDPDAAEPDDEADEEWQEGEEQRYFIAPCFYLEGYPDRLAAEKKILESLDAAELGKLTTLMKRLGIGWVNVDAEIMSCGLFEILLDAGEIMGIVRAMNSFALLFEKEGEQVDAQPSFTVDGVAVNPELIAAVMLCPYCNQNVAVKKDRKCPNCGAGL